MKGTDQRRAVWNSFVGEVEAHLTADEVFERFQRELPEVEVRGALVYDANPDPEHQHFRCSSCGRLYDVHLDGAEGLRISGGGDFVVERKSIMLDGICPGCSTERG